MKKDVPYREIPSVTSLSPEECIERLQNLIEFGIRVVIHKKNEDEYHFEADMWEDNQIKGRAEGTLKRWEGTSTRLKLDMKLTESQKRRTTFLRWQIPFIALMFSAGLIVVLGLDFNNAAILTGIIFLLSLVPGPVIKSLWSSKESNDLVWILGNTLNGKPLLPSARIRSVEEIGLDEYLNAVKSKKS